MEQLCASGHLMPLQRWIVCISVSTRPFFQVLCASWTHLSYGLTNCLRTRYTLANANSVCICARFFAIPR